MTFAPRASAKEYPTCVPFCRYGPQCADRGRLTAAPIVTPLSGVDSETFHLILGGPENSFGGRRMALLSSTRASPLGSAACH